MESTGAYWIPVKNILEVRFPLVLICAKKQKPARGEKTGFGDVKNRAHLHRHGRLKALVAGTEMPAEQMASLRKQCRRQKLPQLTET